MQGRRGWDKMEQCLGLNGRQLFGWVDCNLEEIIRDLFLMLHHLSGTVSLSKLDQTHSHLLNHLWYLTSSSYPIDSVWVCVLACVGGWVCVCVGGGGVVWSGVYGSLFWLCFVLCFVMGYVLQFGDIAHKRVHYHYITCFNSRPCNFHNGLIKLPCILYLGSSKKLLNGKK